MSAALAGRLLVASPELTDPNFARTVVLVCAHSAEGSFGLVLNRPLVAERVAYHLPDWAGHSVEPPILFQGGPVEPSAAIALGRFSGTGEREGLVEVIPGVGLIGLEKDASGLPHGLLGVRLFSGYSGWSAGQLDREIDEGGWFVVDARPADPFLEDPSPLWRDVLRRQRSQLAMYAFYPETPNVN